MAGNELIRRVVDTRAYLTERVRHAGLAVPAVVTETHRVSKRVGGRNEAVQAVVGVRRDSAVGSGLSYHITEVVITISAQ